MGIKASSWNVDKSKNLYGISQWGNGYFDINKEGNILVCPRGIHKEQVDLLELTKDLRERGIRCPVLIRFPDITKERIQLLTQCFEKAIQDYDYKGSYRGVYPIKVNQQRHLVEEIVRFGSRYGLGLECGSKPELLISLALLENSESLLLCNGFKDEEYVETALLAGKLGHNIIIVVERLDELRLVIRASKKFKIKPKIGFRMKLYSKSSGRWLDSAGARSKFGLTTSEIFTAFELLKKENQLESLDLIHFHIGSQVPSIKTIKTSLREGAQVYAELLKLGTSPTYLDVGGGLGVDYDGSGCTDSSVDYTVQEYANDVVSIVQEVCEEKKVPMPTIITEAGRSLVAYHSVLVFDIMGLNRVERKAPPLTIKDSDHNILQELKEIYENLNLKNLNESLNDLIYIQEKSLQLFIFGLLSLSEKSKVEQYYWSIMSYMCHMLENEKDHKDLHKRLKEELSDTYFCNFSVFQSLPDSWAVGQTFPVIPIHRLNEEPLRRATLVDLTCDSDGKISHFIDPTSSQTQKTLRVHDCKPQHPYFFGVFLVGAYQEILGDLHNLFGDTDAVHISIHKNGYKVNDVVEGDTIGEVLTYVQYNLEKLLNKMRRATDVSIGKGRMSQSEARTLIRYYQKGLAGYTYMEDPEEEI